MKAANSHRHMSALIQRQTSGKRLRAVNTRIVSNTVQKVRDRRVPIAAAPYGRYIQTKNMTDLRRGPWFKRSC